jgi:hypothetical protein
MEQIANFSLCTKSVLPFNRTSGKRKITAILAMASIDRYHLSARHDICLMQGSVIRTIDALLGPWNSDGTDVTLQLPAPHTRQPRLLSTG